MGILSAIGGIIGSGLNFLGKSKEIDLQKDFAKKGIQWKVADATKAGLHPLAALGANTMSYQPVGLGDGLSASMESMGQNIDSAIDRTRNGTEKINTQLGALQLERAGLENDLLRSQIAQLNRQPPMPTDGGAGELIPGQAQSVSPELVLAGNKTIKLPPGLDAESGQRNEDALGDTGGEVLNAWNTWKTAKYNPMTLAKMAAELGYSLTPQGMMNQYLPTPEQIIKLWKTRFGPPKIRERR